MSWSSPQHVLRLIGSGYVRGLKTERKVGAGTVGVIADSFAQGFRDRLMGVAADAYLRAASPDVPGNVAAPNAYNRGWEFADDALREAVAGGKPRPDPGVGEIAKSAPRRSLPAPARTARISWQPGGLFGERAPAWVPGWVVRHGAFLAFLVLMGLFLGALFGLVL